MTTEQEHAEMYRQARLENVREALEEKREEAERLEAFQEAIEGADRDQLEEWFGTVLADARSHNRDVIEVRIWLDNDGSVSKLASVPMDSHAYSDVPRDVSFRVACDSWLSYEDVHQTAERAVRNNLLGARDNVRALEKEERRFSE